MSAQDRYRGKDVELARDGYRQSFLRVCLLLATLPLLVSAGSTTTDSSALQQFAVQTNLTSWLSRTGSPCASGWPGVTCNIQQRVTQLQLVNYGNTGQFPAFLDQLDALEILQLSNGQLFGTLPSSWSLAFPFLQQLDLSSNNITGGTPDSWTDTGSFPNLTTLNLSGAFNKNTTRDLPFQAGRQGMANLAVLNLALCNITGSLTASWGSGLSQLSTLILSSNSLTGILPVEWGTSPGTSNLTELQLDGNALYGTLQPSWGQPGSFTHLQRLNLASNKLKGALPAGWGGAGAFPALSLLQLNNNNFTGTLPDPWAVAGAFPQLATVYLQGNSLMGGIPLSWANNRPNMLKYLRPGNPSMCEPIRARLSGVRVFGSTSPALSCLDGGCNEAGDIASSLALGPGQSCIVTVAANGSITANACPPGEHGCICLFCVLSCSMEAALHLSSKLETVVRQVRLMSGR